MTFISLVLNKWWDLLFKMWEKWFNYRSKFNGRFFDKKDYLHLRKDKT